MVVFYDSIPKNIFITTCQVSWVLLAVFVYLDDFAIMIMFSLMV